MIICEDYTDWRSDDINICVYGTTEDRNILIASVSLLDDYAFRKVSFVSFDNYDAYVDALKEKHYDAVFVTADNSDGMEGVIAAKSIFPQMPVVWFSNDCGFGAQSYRLGCAYFSEKRFMSEKIAAALSHC